MFEHEGMYLTYKKTPNGLQQIGFSTTKPDGNLELGSVSSPNFQLAVAGSPHGFNYALITGYTTLPYEMTMEEVKKEEHKITFRYRHGELGLVVIVEMQFIPGSAVIRQFTTVVNESDEPITLTHLSSVCMEGVTAGGVLPWYDSRKFRLYYCVQTWQGEGQWRIGGFEELGLYPTSVHPCSSGIHFSSVGSWSTGRYLPMAVLEDLETGSVWYFQIETSTNWHFEIGYRNSWTDTNGGVFIHLDGADERFGGWTKELLPGEKFTAVPAAIGCCKGTFDDAIRQLTKYRREVLKPKDAWIGPSPLVFNDYMNCLWANPTRDKLVPLINAAAEVGAEAFCIDAGWFKPGGGMERLGDWEPCDELFGNKGLQGILEYIRTKGMIPGLWLEMEVCSEHSELAKKPDSWFLRRNGKRVHAQGRLFLNFANPDVRGHVLNVIDRLVEMGVGYIKNDYNACIGNGDDTIGTSAADGLLTHMRCFYEFIDEVRERYPELILENCGSGGMRADYGVLSHFHLQSTSDQEFYHKNPSVIVGALAGILPEQAGIWVYPYPLPFNDRERPELLQSPEYQISMADGEQTIFNMVNGLCGNMYLSGHIEVADELNTKLIKEGVALYKKERKHIHEAYPIWPIGFTRINDVKSWASVGLVSHDEARILLAVWRLENDADCCEIPLSKWRGKTATVRQLYPEKGFDVDYHYDVDRGRLTVRFPKTYQARYFEVCFDI